MANGKGTNNDIQNITQKKTDRTILTPPEEHRWSGSV